MGSLASLLSAQAPALACMGQVAITSFLAGGIDLSALVFRQLAASLLCHHISGMAKTHPHAEATYEVITLPGSTFGVKVSIPDIYPTTVSTFATKAAAKAGLSKTRAGSRRIAPQPAGSAHHAPVPAFPARS